jgi:hypothetical protein
MDYITHYENKLKEYIANYVHIDETVLISNFYQQYKKLFDYSKRIKSCFEIQILPYEKRDWLNNTFLRDLFYIHTTIKAETFVQYFKIYFITKNIFKYEKELFESDFLERIYDWELVVRWFTGLDIKEYFDNFIIEIDTNILYTFRMKYSQFIIKRRKTI